MAATNDKDIRDAVEAPESHANIDRLRDFFKDLIGVGRRFSSAREMAQLLHLEPSRATILYKFLKGAEPRAGIVLDWLDRLGISVVYPNDESRHSDNIEFIPVLTGLAGAGEYIPQAGDEEYRQFRAVDRQFINRLSVTPSQCYFLDVIGDSMEPLFSDGSTLLVDCSDNAKLYPVDGKIYVVSYHDAVMVKRVKITPEQITLCSENPLRKPIPIPIEDLDSFRVLGRVRWYSVNA